MSYVNNLRLYEIATGGEDGTWGTKTNTNLELIADAFGSGTEAIADNADNHTTTIADGAADEARAIFLKYTGTLDSACTILLAPNTINKLWFIENATSGSQNIIISQGSGANITIGNGNVAAVYTNGAGSGAAVIDAFADLELSSTLTVAGASTLTGAVTAGAGITVTGTTPTVTIGDAGAEDTKLVFDGNAQDFYMGLDDSADDLVIGLGSTVGTTPAVTIDEDQAVVFPAATVTIGDGTAEDTKLVYDGNAVDFYMGLDDSADKLVIGVGSTVGTNSILTLDNDSLTIGDASAVDTKVVFDGNAQDFYVGLDDSADDLVIGVGSTVGTTPAISVTEDQDVIMTATKKLYLDGGGNSYIYEASADSVQVVAGGTASLFVTDAGIGVPATNKIWLDNGGNTYIRESSGDTICFTTEGSDNFKFASDSGNPSIQILGNAGGATATVEYSEGGEFFWQHGVRGADEKWYLTGNATLHSSYALMISGQDVAVGGELTAGTKTFRIPHPLPSMAESHTLSHACIESPRADLQYRGVVTLSSGAASVDLDESVGITDGTWEALCRDPQVFLQNDTGWSALKGSVSGSTLTISCEDTDSTDTVSWMVVAERDDPTYLASRTTDDDGVLILEEEKPEEVEDL
jgi:hypothetical protein